MPALQSAPCRESRAPPSAPFRSRSSSRTLESQAPFPMIADKPAWPERVLPLLGTLRRYDRESARGDLVAGLTVALFTIPQGMAYALIAGLPPATGIYASVLAVTLGAAF